MRIRLGTRGSKLALIQSELVARRLRALGHDLELVRITTEGDVRSIDMSAGEGVFVAAIARALVRGDIDIAVHSAKDVPLVVERGLVIAAYPERADPRDALVTTSGGSALESLPGGAVVGTDSPRRAGFVRAGRPDLKVVPLHGNVDTRLRRLDAGEVDALVLAAAGLDRLGLGERIDQRLEPEAVPPAPGQAALAVQARVADSELLNLVRGIDRPDIRLAVQSERRVLEATGGTCRSPVGALATVHGDRYMLLAGGVNSDGTGKRLERLAGRPDEAMHLGEQAGRRLLAEVALR